MHYFYYLSSASRGFDSRPPAGLHSWTSLSPLKDFRPQTLNLPTPGKNLGGAHAGYNNRTYIICYLYEAVILNKKAQKRS